MTREEAKKLMPVIQAFADGKDVETKTGSGWMIVENMSFAGEPDGYRIKLESKYRPFKSVKECWEEMQNHLPFGWVKTIHDEDPEVFIHCEVITKIDGVLTSIDEVPFSYDNMYRTYTFADGTPFGILEED